MISWIVTEWPNEITRAVSVLEQLPAPIRECIIELHYFRRCLTGVHCKCFNIESVEVFDCADHLFNLCTLPIVQEWLRCHVVVIVWLLLRPIRFHFHFIFN